MRITEAAERLGTSARMLRYRDMLGLLPPVREAAPRRRRAGPLPDLRRAAAPQVQGQAAAPRVQGQAAAPRDLRRAGAPRVQGQAGIAPAGGRAPGGRARGHRRFADDDLAAVAHALQIEQRYDISPAALAFGLKVLTEPGVRAEVAELGRRIGRIAPPPARALDFEKQRALRLLNLARSPGPRP